MKAHARSCDGGTWGGFGGHREQVMMRDTRTFPWASWDGKGDGDMRASTVELAHDEWAMLIGIVAEMWVHGDAAKGSRIAGVVGRTQAWKVGSS